LGASFSTGVSGVEEVFICFDFAQRGVRGWRKKMGKVKKGKEIIFFEVL
jgi:hypothetical protein